MNANSYTNASTSEGNSYNAINERMPRCINRVNSKGEVIRKYNPVLDGTAAGQCAIDAAANNDYLRNRTSADRPTGGLEQQECVVVHCQAVDSQTAGGARRKPSSTKAVKRPKAATKAVKRPEAATKAVKRPKVHTGPRGGKFIITGGRKVYQ